MNRIGKIFAVLGVILAWGVLFFSAYKTTDPDFGWHVQVGRILWEKGIPETDPFSYTMPSWRWVDHGRLSDMGIFWLHERGGKLGLAAISATLVLLAFVIAIPNRLKTWSVLPLLLGFGAILTRSGIRPQIEDWVGLSILLWMLETNDRWRKRRFLVPLMFAVWANLHGGFVAGLGVMAVDMVVAWWIKERRDVKDLFVLGMSGLATLFTPYGLRLWEEIWLTVSDTHLRMAIVEWRPFFTRAELGFWFLAGLVVAFIKLAGVSFKKRRLVVTGVLFAAGLSSLRNVPLFILAVVPLIAEGFRNLWEEMKENKEKARRAKIFYLGLLLIGGLVAAIETGVAVRRTLTSTGLNYPEAAVSYLKTNGYEGRMMSTYGWGGYLIWQMPGDKVFIDGRMPSWRWQAPAGESDWAMKDYEKIWQGDYKELFEKYDIRTFLGVKPQEPQKRKGLFTIKLEGEEPDSKNLIDKLEEEGWLKTYEDDIAVVYMNKGDLD